MTKAPVASIKHRLAPSHTFPAPILDALVAYVSLLYPPAGAPYRPVPANKIILAGNSSGTNLCFGLTKVLLELQKLPRSDASIDFHRRRVTLPLPAGIATVGGWCDQCDALPSWHRNGEYDCLGVLQPPCMPGFPTDSVWPANPPREHPYCVAATLDHELVTPAAVGDWTGAPPMLLLCGCEEAGVDGNRVVASQAAKSGVSVLWNEYEGMPHEFPLIMSSLPQAKHAFELWARTCKDFAESKPVRSSAVRWLMPDCGKEDLGDPRNLSPLPFTEVRRRMREYNATRSVWTGKLGQPRL
ncbi:alpha/beta-hydrolase [Aspergillus sclerotioniger CBS 115572]|uniref:Alpha/beta-hydrolase n=1 Tax=Aspergillus sclerotioniger CBS 115572 TaxID=1450535 RepID=A0A317W985_9EURO|nr:alpha/beta-hydrolase [Aspergillus sclerotioniger CBS 115572]PWY81568.1 alpha/beta-hydrolase [Aspergillus sclerotioniger CBS 115572]